MKSAMAFITRSGYSPGKNARTKIGWIAGRDAGMSTRDIAVSIGGSERALVYFQNPDEPEKK